jgi:Glyoxalase-like domain
VVIFLGEVTDVGANRVPALRINGGGTPTREDAERDCLSAIAAAAPPIRRLALGAHRADIGQTGAESWTVLADPEGNEFCVVRPKETLIR